MIRFWFMQFWFTLTGSFTPEATEEEPEPKPLLSEDSFWQRANLLFWISFGKVAFENYIHRRSQIMAGAMLQDIQESQAKQLEASNRATRRANSARHKAKKGGKK